MRRSYPGGRLRGMRDWLEALEQGEAADALPVLA
jgi:hypothetical protein